ncbi:hypothetical protein DVH24_007495 [Malus domestica]|uniref:Uncharacterized protein n=1 Tax=Malus domestica TaxID=3750 RepID=A0A498HGW2_MALDO|nr:hypothetical protein DVH24_007495 [Malus domestica]
MENSFVLQEVIEPAISQLETFCETVENLLSSSEPVGDALSQSSVDIEEGAASDSSLVQNATYENRDKRSSNGRVHLDDIQFYDFVNLVEPCKRNPAIIRSCPADALSISNSCLTTDATVSPPNGIELHNSFDELKSAVPLPVCNSFEDQSTMPFPESEAWDNDIAKSGLQTTQSLNIKLDESCIKVDGTRIQSISCEEAKCGSYKPADPSGNLDAGFDQQKEKISQPPQSLRNLIHRITNFLSPSGR